MDEYLLVAIVCWAVSLSFAVLASLTLGTLMPIGLWLVAMSTCCVILGAVIFFRWVRR